jgi:hypothetical protein
LETSTTFFLELSPVLTIFIVDRLLVNHQQQMILHRQKNTCDNASVHVYQLTAVKYYVQVHQLTVEREGEGVASPCPWRRLVQQGDGGG